MHALKILNLGLILTSSSAIAERPRCRVGYLWPKVEDCKWETTLYGHYRSVFNNYDVIGQQSNRIRWENAKRLLRRSRSFKVIEVGIRRKPVCDFLLVINSNWHSISCRFGVIAVYCSIFWHFALLSHPLGDLEITYDVHLGLIGKRVGDFLSG